MLHVKYTMPERFLSHRRPRRNVTVRETVELVLQPGSDEEEDVTGGFPSSNKELLDSDSDNAPKVGGDKWSDASDTEMEVGTVTRDTDSVSEVDESASGPGLNRQMDVDNGHDSE